MKRLEVLLDSGAYTAFNKGTKISIDEYIAFIHENAKLFDHCINLDVIGNAKDSYRNWKYLKSNGVNAIPVYHLGTDEKWLVKYLKQTDYISLGAVANLDTTQRMYGLRHIWEKYLQDRNGTPTHKIHGLGLTAIDIASAHPWYSLDSSAAVKAAAYGKIFVPLYRKSTNKFDFRDSFMLCVSDQLDYKTRVSTAYFSYPKTLRDCYSKFVQERGYSIGSIKGRKIRPKRSDKGRKSIEYPSLINEHDVSANNTNTLASNYKLRYAFNISIWNEITKLLGGTKIYHVCSTPAHLFPLYEICEYPRVLVNYLVLLSGSMKENLQKLRDGRDV